MRKLVNFIENLYYYFILVWKSPNNFKINYFRSFIMRFLGFTPDQYTLYNLSENNINDYFSEYFRWKTRRINGKYKIILDDKLIFYKVFSNRLNLPPVLYYVLNNRIVDKNGNGLPDDSLISLMMNQEIVFLKPLNSGGGKGISKLEFRDSKWLINGIVIDENQLLKTIRSNDDYICTGFVSQTGFSNSIYPKTVNTIRIVSGYDKFKNEVEIYHAIHRFGTDSSFPVDNASRGGLFAKIDIKSGILSKGMDYKNSTYKVHPNTGEKIEGARVPNWDNIINYCKTVALEYSFIPYMAWDISASESKIDVIEINSSTDLQILQVFGGLKNSPIHKFYKDNKIC